jgi:esterase/lipase superfamily enzyme
MLLLNLRSAESTIVFSPKPHWSVADGEDMSITEVRAHLAGKRVLVLVHGYNVQDAFDAYSRMGINIAQHKLGYDEIIGVQWPGSKVSLAFLLAAARANKAGRKLQQALSILDGVAVLDIEGHSLGCRVICEAVVQGLRPRLIVLAGAAIDNHSVHKDETYGIHLASVPLVLIARSGRDAVLRTAYSLASWDNALGLTGPEDSTKVTANVHTVDLTEFVPEHSAYKKCEEFYLAWKAAVNQLEGD